MSVGKGSIQRAASAEAKKTTTRKKAVKTTVLTPQNSEEPLLQRSRKSL